jgi:hypothetical protein
LSSISHVSEIIAQVAMGRDNRERNPLSVVVCRIRESIAV